MRHLSGPRWLGFAVRVLLSLLGTAYVSIWFWIALSADRTFDRLIALALGLAYSGWVFFSIWGDRE